MDENNNWEILREWRGLTRQDCNWFETYRNGIDANQRAFWLAVLADAMPVGDTYYWKRIKSVSKMDKESLEEWLQFMEKRVEKFPAQTGFKRKGIHSIDGSEKRTISGPES